MTDLGEIREYIEQSGLLRDGTEVTIRHTCPVCKGKGIAVLPSMFTELDQDNKDRLRAEYKEKHGWLFRVFIPIERQMFHTERECYICDGMGYDKTDKYVVSTKRGSE